jgi:ribonucleotide monophosphatase NagD (HAD superfamily)
LIFGYDAALQQKVKQLGGMWSQTHRCWYVDYNSENYKCILEEFAEDEIVVDTTKNKVQQSAAATASLFEGNDIPSTALAMGRSEIPASPRRMGHKPAEGTTPHPAAFDRADLQQHEGAKYKDAWSAEHQIFERDVGRCSRLNVGWKSTTCVDI